MITCVYSLLYYDNPKCCIRVGIQYVSYMSVI